MSTLEKIVRENSLAEQVLMHKLQTKTAKLAVIGLGYVGLPLAVEKARAGYRVIGIDIQASRVEKVNAGINYIGDVVDNDLKCLVQEGFLSATTDFDILAEADAVSICVPTPLDKYKQPDLSYVGATSKEVAKRLHRGMLVVLESTTYPGTTEEMLLPLLQSTGLKCGVDFFLAFSPERVDPGNKHYNTKNTPKVVGGVTLGCTNVAATLYRNVLEGEIFEASSPRVAEMEKIYENTFRNINIALANEMALLCHRMGVDVWEVIDAASTKPYGFMPFYPGPGIGGHCIPIDPFYLTWKAREYEFHTKLIETASEINDYMPEYTLERIIDALNHEGKPMRGSRILILGVAYKKDIDDWRESPALKLIQLMTAKGSTVEFFDPYVPVLRFDEGVKKTIDSIEQLGDFDIVVLHTDHSCFNYDDILDSAKLVYDARNAIKIRNQRVIRM